MMDLMKAMQDPEFVQQMTQGPALMAKRLENIENGIAAILQICNRVEWYVSQMAKADGLYIADPVTTAPPVGEDSPIESK